MYEQLMYFHLATVVPCVLIGAAQFAMKKGTTLHRSTGKVFMVLMLITGVVTLLMPARVGPQLFNHFGWIHLFSLLTIVSVPRAYFAIRRGDVSTHKYSLIGLYVGGIIIAGGFTFAPGRYLHSVFFN